MNYKTTIGVTMIAIVLIGGGCLARGNVDIDTVQTLPDHITEIQAGTLPQAILEARERGLSSVKVTDPNGNVIAINISQPTHTVFSITDPGEDIEPITFMAGFSVDLSKAYNIIRADGVYSFTVNTVRNDDLSTIIYELSIRMFNLRSTQDWVIDLEM